MYLEDCKLDIVSGAMPSVAPWPARLAAEGHVRPPTFLSLKPSSRLTPTHIGLDDLCVRFIINLPQDDLSSVERICFAVEEAQWYYEDFIRPLDPSLPSMSLRTFCIRIFAHCPLLSSFSQGDHMQAFEQFLQYKLRIPVRGAIMLNEAMDSVLLVKGWKKGANWSFPRGKINKDEDDLICAIREVYEETGYDLDAAGLVPADRNVKYIDLTIRDQDLRLYVFRGVPMDTHFEPKTRKEISKIQWWRISDLPSFHKKGHQQQAEAAINANKFYMVAPFIKSVRKWAIEQKHKDSARTSNNHYLSAGMSHDEFMTEEDQGAESNVPETSSGVPNINLLETALRTALKIQPPTQGLQLDALNAIQSPARDSGQELLALLQGRTRPTNAVPQSNLPHQTPQDHISSQPPIQTNPHHQPPRPSVFHNFPPAPVFPPNLRTEPTNYPPQAARNPLSNLPPPPAFPPQLQGSHSQLNSNHQAHYHPFNAHTFQQAQMQSERRPEPMTNNPHSHQHQHLVHPQPLPPQVQRTVFTGGPMQAPTVPQPPQQPMAPSLASTTSQIPNPLNAHSGIPLSLPKQPPPKLNDHSLALLNAFKGRDQAAANAAASNHALLPGVASERRQAPPQELPAEVSNAPRVDLLSMFRAQQPEPHAVSNTSTALPQPRVSDTHRSSLLNLFKSPPRTSATPKPTATATAFPTSTTPSAVELSAVEPLSSNAAPTSIPSVDGQGVNYKEKNSFIPELHPESNLPFRAMSILARPTEANGLDRHGGSAPSHKTPSNEVKAKNKQSGRTPARPTEKPFHPQILKRPQPQTQTAAEPAKTVSPAPSALPVGPSFDRRSSQTADHKQALLSLFGKSPSPPAPAAQNLAGANLAQLQATGPATGLATTPARTRVGSLASEGPSRNGSQALSPADKSFLLSYLDTVAKGTHL